MKFLKIPTSLLLKLANPSSHLATNFSAIICSDLKVQVADLPHFPTDPQLGIEHFKEGNFKDAIDVFEQCLRWGLSEGKESYMQRLIFDMKFWQVLCHYVAGDFSRSVEELFAVYKQLEDFEALFPQDYMIYSLCLGANGEYKKAGKTLKKGLKKYPENEDLRLFMARYYFRPGMLRKAISNYRLLCTMEPQNIIYLSELACAHLLNGYDMDPFRKVANQAKAQVPLSKFQNYRLGLMYYLGSQYDEAKDFFNHSRGIAPWYSNPWEDPELYRKFGL